MAYHWWLLTTCWMGWSSNYISEILTRDTQKMAIFKRSHLFFSTPVWVSIFSFRGGVSCLWRFCDMTLFETNMTLENPDVQFEQIHLHSWWIYILSSHVTFRELISCFLVLKRLLRSIAHFPIPEVSTSWVNWLTCSRTGVNGVTVLGTCQQKPDFV